MLVKFAMSADPHSPIFPSMNSSRQTVTRRMVDIHRFLIKETRDDVSSSLFWSAMTDETTDSSVIEQVITYVRFVNVANKSIETRFLGVDPINGHPNLENIFNLIKATFDKFELPKDSMVGFTSDGASVMTGVKNGVAKLKAEYNPKLFTQHCFNHRLVLASKDAKKEIPHEVEATIKDILDHFKYSPVAQSKLREICELNSEPFVKLIEYHKVRWLSLEECIDRLHQLHDELGEYFESRSQDVDSRKSARDCCEDLYERLCDPSFNLYIAFLNFYLPMLGELNQLFQEENVTLLYAYKKILTTKKFLAEAVLIDVNKPDDVLLKEDNLRFVDEARYDQTDEDVETDDEDNDCISFPSAEFLIYGGRQWTMTC